MNDETSNSSTSYDEVMTAAELKTNLESGTNSKLMNDISDCTNMITISNKEVSLDLNGHILAFTNTDGNYGIIVENSAKLTINSLTSASGSITRNIPNGNNGVVYVKSTSEPLESSLILNNCNISVTDSKGNISGYGLVAGNYSSITCGPDVEITAGYSAISGNGELKDAKVVINGGKYTSNTSAAIFFPSTSTLTVTGGEFIGKTGFDIRAGTVSISNATISLNKTGIVDKTGTSGPSSWGMGIAVIDHSSYASNSNINITINDVTVTGAEYDIYVGDLNRNATDGLFITDNFDTTFNLKHNISLTVSKNSTDILKYDVEKSSSDIGRIISSIDGVIEVNSEKTLQNAVNLCSGTIKLTNGITINEMINVKNKNTLDLAGNTLSAAFSDKCLIKVFSSGELTITDPGNSTKGTITNTAESTNYAVIQCGESEGTGGKVIIKDGVNISSTNGYGILVIDYANLLVENAVITTNESAISGNGLFKDAEIEIKNGTFTSNASAAIYFPSTAKLTVTGGTFEGLTGFDIRAGTVNISDAKIKATGNTGADSKFNASNGPSGWGMGIAVFDHSSYSIGDDNKTITVTIADVTFENCNTCNIFVGKHPGDISNAKSPVPFSDVRTFTPDHEINVTIDDVTFETKGLYINGANNVTVKDCEFTDITSPVTDNMHDAIQLTNCRGAIEVTDNVITTVNIAKENKLNKGIGINIIYPGTECTINISDNKVTGVAHNAIIVQDEVSIDERSVVSVKIKDNILTNWDTNSAANTADNKNDLSYGGRAIRLAVNIASNGTSEVSGNTFVKEYNENHLYDPGNVMKVSGSDATFTENILALSGSFDKVKLFEFVSDLTDANHKYVFFNPNGGYFYSSLIPGLMCTIISGDAVAISEPDTDPSRSGSYSFDDWYTEATGGEEWNFDNVVSADTTLYAKWTYTGGSGGGVPITPPATDDTKTEEVKNDDGTISSITETTTKKENADGSKETTVKKEEVVKDENGNVQSVIEEKQSEVVSKDGSVSKTSETTVKDSNGKVLEEKTEIEIEDKNTGVSTSVEIKKDSEGKTTSEIKTEASIETKDGKAQVDSQALNEALKQAEEAKKTAEEKGAKNVTPVIEIEAENSKDFTETEISTDDLSKLAEAEVEVKIKTATGEVNLPPEVSKSLSSNADEKVSLSFGEADKNKLTEEQKKTVGDSPVFEFNLKSGENEIHDLGGTAKVTVPYELKKGEDPNKITVWYIDESGKPVAMKSVYDPETKSITFETSHFSYYFIAEDAAIPDDNKDDSNNNSIYYAVAAIIVILIIIALAYYFMKKKQ